MCRQNLIPVWVDRQVHLFVAINFIRDYFERSQWIVIRAPFMDPCILVVILVVGVFVREPVRVKVAFADDDG